MSLPEAEQGMTTGPETKVKERGKAEWDRCEGESEACVCMPTVLNPTGHQSTNGIAPLITAAVTAREGDPSPSPSRDAVF
jgi:hypothetical protein